MKIGIISDTHDRLPTFKTALAMLADEKVEAILHAGDLVAPFAAKLISADAVGVPVHVIYGNNDGERAGLKKVLPQIVDGPVRIELGGRVIAMHHFVDWFKPADLAGADLVVSGHNHVPSIETRGGAVYLNPGECCGWVNGRCTCAVADLGTMEARLIDVAAS